MATNQRATLTDTKGPVVIKYLVPRDQGIEMAVSSVPLAGTFVAPAGLMVVRRKRLAVAGRRRTILNITGPFISRLPDGL